MNRMYLVALGNHSLLGQKDLLRRNFNAEISAGNHDTVRGFDDLVQIVNSLVVFNLRNDKNALALFTCL